MNPHGNVVVMEMQGPASRCPFAEMRCIIWMHWCLQAKGGHCGAGRPVAPDIIVGVFFFFWSDCWGLSLIRAKAFYVHREVSILVALCIIRACLQWPRHDIVCGCFRWPLHAFKASADWLIEASFCLNDHSSTGQNEWFRDHQTTSLRHPELTR